MKLIIASLLVFSLIILFLFALFPSDVSVTRILRISGGASRVHQKISNLNEWKNWNELVVQTDSGSAENENVPSHISEIVTNGVSIRIIQSLPDTIKTIWQKDKKSFTGTFILVPAGGQTIVEWTLYFHVRWYPWEKLASMFYDKELGPVMEKSLLNLQKQVGVAGSINSSGSVERIISWYEFGFYSI